VADVLRSGANTYTVTCVAPSELDGIWERAVAYLRRDKQFLVLICLWGLWGVVALGMAAGIWAALFIVVAIEALVVFAWATK